MMILVFVFVFDSLLLLVEFALELLVFEVGGGGVRSCRRDALARTTDTDTLSTQRKKERERERERGGMIK